MENGKGGERELRAGLAWREDRQRNERKWRRKTEKGEEEERRGGRERKE